MENLTTLLRLGHEKQRQFQEAADSLARLEGDLDEYQKRIETAIASYMDLHDLNTLILHSPYLPVEEVWLCRLPYKSESLTMTRVPQAQACAIKEVPF